MSADREIVVHDRRQPAWEWSAELTDTEREEMARLRSERDELRTRLKELHIAAQDSHDREQALRSLVKELSTGSWPSRLAAARRMRQRRVSS